MFLCVYIIQEYGMGNVHGQAGNDAAPYIDGVVFFVPTKL